MAPIRNMTSRMGAVQGYQGVGHGLAPMRNIQSSVVFEANSPGMVAAAYTSAPLYRTVTLVLLILAWGGNTWGHGWGQGLESGHRVRDRGQRT